MRFGTSQLALCMLSPCYSNVCCSAVACDSTRLFLRLLLSGAHTVSLSFHIATATLLCCYSTFVRSSIPSSSFCLCGVTVSHTPLMAVEAVCTGAVESGGSARVNPSSPMRRLSKTRRATPRRSSSSRIGRERRNRLSAAVPCVPCVRCAKRFAGAPGYICERHCRKWRSPLVFWMLLT